MEEFLLEDSDYSTTQKQHLARLLHDNYEIVYRYMLKLTFNKQLTEDIVQEAMIKAIENISRFDQAKAKFSSWLISIAQNIYIDHIRKEKRHNQSVAKNVASLLAQGDQACNVHAFDDNETWMRVLDALSNLPDEIRIPIVMKHYYGYSIEEIAGMMAVPQGTVKSRIHNGLKKIRKELSNE